MDALGFVRGLRPPAPAAAGTPPPPAPASVAPPRPAQPQQPQTAFHGPLLRLWPRGGGEKGAHEAVRLGERRDRRRQAEAEAEVEKEVEKAEAEGRRQENWVLRILRVQPRSDEADAQAAAVDGGGEAVEVADGGGEAVEVADGGDRSVACGGGDGGDADGCCVVDDEEPLLFDRASFSKLLRKVSLAEAKVYSKMSYLSNLAYIIPKIKPKYLQRYNLQFVTSSVENKMKSLGSDQEQKPSRGECLNSDEVQGPSDDQEAKLLANDTTERKKEKENGHGMNPFAAYQIATSAASFLHSRARGFIPFGSGNRDSTSDSTVNGEGVPLDETSFVATTNSVTSMVAAKEETKQAVADDLNSSRSSPCEWFICDDDQSGTRYFVIQGSETMASWQANLLFEPIKFEELDVLVHRGIYEAAKGIYQQMLPYVQVHLNRHGKSATLRFTGHSLGGSLALLVNLMLLIRGEASASSLLPVITFGAPSIMCGGDNLLSKLGLPKSHVQSITMHRDIVPRAFSCNYPDHVAQILMAVNGNFRSHPCLTHQKLLYASVGKVVILQPEERFSPHHHLLPPGSGLYLLGDALRDSEKSLRVLQAAKSAFFNSPHPLEILSDRSAYGAKGTVYRDHDVNAYLRSVRAVVRKEMKNTRKAKRGQRRLIWWPLVFAQEADEGTIIGPRDLSANMNRQRFNFAGAVHGGRESLRRFRRLVVSQRVHLLVLFLLPARWLVLGVLSVIRFN